MIGPDEIIDSADFIDASTADPIPANNAGKVVKLEANGKFDTQFAESGIVEMTAGETISGATLPVPVYYNPSDGEVYICDPEDSSTGGSRKGKWVGFAITDSTDGNPIEVKISGIVEGFSGLTPFRNYYLHSTAGQIHLEGLQFNGRSGIQVGRSISATQLFLERGARWYYDGHLAHNDETDVTVHECGFLPDRIYITMFPNYASASTQIIYSRAFYLRLNAGSTYGGNGTMWSYEPDGNPSNSSSGSPGYDNPAGTLMIDVGVDAVDDISFTITTTPANGGPEKDARLQVEAYGTF